MGFSRQEYWSGLSYPPPGDLPDLGIEPVSLTSPAVADGFFTTSPPGKPSQSHKQIITKGGRLRSVSVLTQQDIHWALLSQDWICIPSGFARRALTGSGKETKAVRCARLVSPLVPVGAHQVHVGHLKRHMGTSLVVRWLRLRAPNAGDLGFSLWSGN